MPKKKKKTKVRKKVSKKVKKKTKERKENEKTTPELIIKTKPEWVRNSLASKSRYQENAGHGAIMSGEFLLNAGETLKIIVGQQGASSWANIHVNEWHGGSGGTFVVRSPSTISQVCY